MFITMNLLSWLILGTLLGLCANIADPTSRPEDSINTLVLANISAVFGGLMASFLLDINFFTFNVIALTIALLTSIFSLFIQRNIPVFNIRR
jgi:uncharacterized membrane protein YeaQ/YmgE (transglycosylase-associated protein family)